jgi:hypothetical protein
LDRKEVAPSLTDVIAPELGAKYWQRMAALRAERVATFAACLAIVGLSIDASFWFLTYRLVPHGHLGAMALSAGLLALMYGDRGRPREWVGTAAFFAINAAILAALWVTDSRIVHLGSWSPFDAQKLGALTVALLTPPRAWVGLVNIAAFTFVPIAELALWDPSTRGSLPPTTPFASVAYGAFACGLLALQLRRLNVERLDAQRRAQGAAVERFARLLLTVRDLANTPLQIIELTLARVGRGYGLDPRSTERLRRACTNLIAIARILEEGRVESQDSCPPS